MDATPARIGPFEIVRELGRGAMGVVYHARRPELDREVALKVIAAGTADSAAAAARFRREAQAAAQLAGHPGIVGVYDIGEDDGLAWFSMELVNGLPFDTVIRDGDLDARGAARIVAQAARAVHHAHRAGIVHRDLKPANIMVTPDGTARVTDFGLVSVQDVHGDLTRITTTDVLVGTPAYMSPEQIEGREPDGRADTYSLGVTLYEALAGQPPFPGESVYTVLHQVISQEPPALRSLAPNVPAELDAIVHKAMAKAPAERYETAAALSADLENWLAGRPVTARSSGTVQRLGKQVRRNRRAVAIGAAAAALLGAGGLLWWGLSRAQEARQGTLKTAEQQGETRDRDLAAADAYRELSRLTINEMRWLESHWNGLTQRREEVERRVAAVEQVVAAVRKRSPGLPITDAWLELARVYATQSSDFKRMEQIVADAGDDPFARILLARLTLLLWAWHLEPPDVVFSRLEISALWGPPPPEQLARTKRAAELLEACAADRATIGTDALDPEFTFLTGALELVRDNATGADAALRQLQDHPELSGVAARLRGHALIRLGRPAEAAAVWEEVAAQRGWLDLLCLANQGLAMTAARHPLEHELGRRCHEKIRIHCEALLRTGIRPGIANGQLAQALQGLAELDALAGTDPEALMQEAVIAAQREMDVTKGNFVSRRRQLQVLSGSARLALWFGRDPTPHLERMVEAADDLVAASPRPGWLFLGRLWRGIARARLARHRFWRGEPADEFLAGAEADLREAAGIQQAVPEPHDWLSYVHRLRADLALTRGESPLPHLEAALQAIRTGIGYSPGSADLRFDLADTLRVVAELGPREGKKPYLLLAEAQNVIGELRRKNPHVDVLSLEGSLFVTQAELELHSGGDPTGSCRAAIEVFERVVKAKRGRIDATVERRWANALWLRAQWEQGQGVDPLPALRGALAHYDRAAGSPSMEMESRSDRALVHLAIGEWAAAAGSDPLPHYERALADQDFVVATRANNAIAYHNRGVTRRSMAKARLARGQDPQPDFRAAAADLEKSVTLDASTPGGFNDLGLLYRVWGEWTDNNGGPPDEIYRKSLAAFDRALTLVPDMPAALNNRGNLLSDLAGLLRRRQMDSRPVLERAISDFDRLLKITPDDVGAFNNRGLLHKRCALVAKDSGESPVPFLRKALADFEQALQRNPSAAATFTNRGLIHSDLAEWATEQGEDPVPHLQRAIQDHGSALQLTPGDPGTLVNRGVARRALAMELQRTKGAWKPVAEEALDDLRQCVERNPQLWQGHAMYGRILADLGRDTEALAAYATALNINPGQRLVLQWRQELKERMQKGGGR